MRVEFDIDVDADDRQPLAQALGCNVADLTDVVAKHGKAALEEYLECYLGRRAFSRGSDILEHRLSLLVRHAFDGKIPTAAQVSDLFQTTLSASRTLIRNTFSKYRFQLEKVAEQAAKDVLEHVTWRNQDACHAKIVAPNLVEQLNRRLLAEDPGLKEVARVPGVVGTYAIDQDAYPVLCRLFNARPVPNP